MTNYRKRVDGNQSEVVEALRKAGASVTILARFGEVVPDLLVGYQGVTYLMEIKRPKEKLTELEQRFFTEWRGKPPVIVYTAEGALMMIGAIATTQPA